MIEHVFTGAERRVGEELMGEAECLGKEKILIGKEKGVCVCVLHDLLPAT